VRTLLEEILRAVAVAGVGVNQNLLFDVKNGHVRERSLSSHGA
jgi:hypothetical protein